MAGIFLFFCRAFSTEGFNPCSRLLVAKVINCYFLTIFHLHCFEKVTIHDLSGSCYFSPTAEIIKKQLITALAIIQLPVGGSACENGFSH